MECRIKECGKERWKDTGFCYQHLFEWIKTGKNEPEKNLT